MSYLLLLRSPIASVISASSEDICLSRFRYKPRRTSGTIHLLLRGSALLGYNTGRGDPKKGVDESI